MSNVPDPARVFASDAHRRVMANLPNPDDDPLSVEGILNERVAKDDHLDLDEEPLVDILSDLEADGDAAEYQGEWNNTYAGFAKLTGPHNEEEV